MVFTPDGNILLTGSNNSLKAWSLQKAEAAMLDNIETTWRGVQRIFLNERGVFGMASSPSGKEFYLYECPLAAISFEARPE